MRYINAIYTTLVGHAVDNATLLPAFEGYLAALPMTDEAREELRNFVRFQLVGQRSRQMYAVDMEAMGDFASRASMFQAGAESALADLAAQILPEAAAAGITFDAILTTTSTGNLMPGLSYRIAHRLPEVVRSNTMMIDLGNVGCTGSSKALHLARALAPEFRNILVVAVELPSTLVDTRSTRPDVWQGNCTFGDGAAALWISSSPQQGDMALALEELHYAQQAHTGLDLIHWEYHRYYAFALGRDKTFNNEVRDHVVTALNDTAGGWKHEPRWAIHPAGISLLVRLAGRLGIPNDALQPSLDHYRQYSNMSSASLIYILKRIAAETPVHAAINLLTMGAGFNVIYGRVRKEE